MPTGFVYLDDDDMCFPHPSSFMITQRRKFDEEQSNHALSSLETKVQGLLMHLSVAIKGDNGD